MSDEKPIESTSAEDSTKTKEPDGGQLNEAGLSKVAAGWGDIKGGSTDDKHKDWSEITGFSHGTTTAS